MNIAIVTVALSHGGAERVGVMLANGFCQQGHTVTILTDCNEPIVYEVDEKVQIVDFVGKAPNKLLKWMKAVVNIRRYLKSVRPDVVIGIMELCTFVSYIASLGLGIPIIMTEHNSFERPASAPMSLSLKIFKFWINKLYKHITVLTKADKKVIGNRLRNVTVMPNPLLLKPVNDIPQKENVVLAAGRVDAWHVKGFDILLQAWKSLSPTLPRGEDSWWLKIAGTGKQESFEYLMSFFEDSDFKCQVSGDGQKIWRSEIYHIEFMGFQKDMESLYKKSEIFVLSSRYEGFGLVLIEAMSQGCACVACDYKGRQREILSPLQDDSLMVNGYSDHGIEVTENGILCEPEDMEALAEAIKKMIDDNKYREGIRMNAIERSKYYSLENTIKRWEAILNIVVKNK